MLDAVVFSTMISTMLNHANSVKIACFAQPVNVLAPIMTEPNGKRMVKQTTFYPFKLASERMIGDAYKPHVECDTFGSVYGTASDICVSAVTDEDGRLNVMVISLSGEETEVDLQLEHFENKLEGEITVLKGKSELDTNTFDNSFNVQPITEKLNGGKVKIAPYSVNFIKFN